MLLSSELRLLLRVPQDPPLFITGLINGAGFLLDVNFEMDFYLSLLHETVNQFSFQPGLHLDMQGTGSLAGLAGFSFTLSVHSVPKEGQCAEEHSLCDFANNPMAILQTVGANLTASATLPFGLGGAYFKGIASQTQVYMSASADVTVAGIALANAYYVFDSSSQGTTIELGATADLGPFYGLAVHGALSADGLTASASIDMHLILVQVYGTATLTLTEEKQGIDLAFGGAICGLGRADFGGSLSLQQGLRVFAAVDANVFGLYVKGSVGFVGSTSSSSFWAHLAVGLPQPFGTYGFRYSTARRRQLEGSAAAANTTAPHTGNTLAPDAKWTFYEIDAHSLPPGRSSSSIGTSQASDEPHRFVFVKNVTHPDDIKPRKARPLQRRRDLAYCDPIDLQADLQLVISNILYFSLSIDFYLRSGNDFSLDVGAVVDLLGVPRVAFGGYIDATGFRLEGSLSLQPIAIKYYWPLCVPFVGCRNMWEHVGTLSTSLSVAVEEDYTGNAFLGFAGEVCFRTVGLYSIIFKEACFAANGGISSNAGTETLFIGLRLPFKLGPITDICVKTPLSGGGSSFDLHACPTGIPGMVEPTSSNVPSGFDVCPIGRDFMPDAIATSVAIEINFGDMSHQSRYSVFGGMHGTIGGIAALRLSTTGYATVPVNINPSTASAVTLEAWVWVVSNPSTYGWLLSTDDGGYDRGLALHDSRFGGGVAALVGTTYQSGLAAPTAGAWSHVVAVFQQGGDSYAFLNGVKGTVHPNTNNNAGLSYLVVGDSRRQGNEAVDVWIQRLTVWHSVLPDATIATRALDTPSTSAYFTVVGPCTVDGACVRSPNYPSNYGNSQSCTITPTSLAAGQLLSATAFDTESCCDKLVLDGVQYSGSLLGNGSLLSNVVLGSSAFEWTSDHSVTGAGWEVCTSLSPLPTPPTPPANPGMIPGHQCKHAQKWLSENGPSWSETGDELKVKVARTIEDNGWAENCCEYCSFCDANQEFQGSATAWDNPWGMRCAEFDVYTNEIPTPDTIRAALDAARGDFNTRYSCDLMRGVMGGHCCIDFSVCDESKCTSSNGAGGQDCIANEATMTCANGYTPAWTANPRVSYSWKVCTFSLPFLGCLREETRTEYRYTCCETNAWASLTAPCVMCQSWGSFTPDVLYGEIEGKNYTCQDLLDYFNEAVQPSCVAMRELLSDVCCGPAPPPPPAPSPRPSPPTSPLPPPSPPHPPPSPLPPVWTGFRANSGKTNVCETGENVITDVLTCMKAADKLGWQYRMDVDSGILYAKDRPGGCVLYDGSDEENRGLYLNDNPGGGNGPTDDWHKVCAYMGS